MRFIESFLNALLHQTAEEGLSYSIIPAGAASTYAVLKVVGLQEALPVIAAILRAMIRVDSLKMREL